MKELIIVRHAKSSWNDSTLSDHERPLNKRGRRDAPEIGSRLARRGCSPELMVSSSAVRALDTATVIAAILGYDPRGIMADDRIYGAGVADLHHVIRDTDESVTTLILIGHNPGLTELANHLGPRQISNMPTCSVLHLRFEVDTWSAMGDVPGEEVFYDYPKR